MDDLIERLAAAYRGYALPHPKLRAVTLAQWLLESGRGSSALAREHLNFAGLKWRPEMAPFATRIDYAAHDGADAYCRFASAGRVHRRLLGVPRAQALCRLAAPGRRSGRLHPLHRADLHAGAGLCRSRAGAAARGGADAAWRWRRGGRRSRHDRARSGAWRHGQAAGQLAEQCDERVGRARKRR